MQRALLKLLPPSLSSLVQQDPIQGIHRVEGIVTNALSCIHAQSVGFGGEGLGLGSGVGLGLLNTALMKLPRHILALQLMVGSCHSEMPQSLDEEERNVRLGVGVGIGAGHSLVYHSRNAGSSLNKGKDGEYNAAAGCHSSDSMLRYINKS